MDIKDFNGLQIQEAISKPGFIPKKELRVLDLMWLGNIFRKTKINTDYMVDNIRQDSINVQYIPEMIWSDFEQYAKMIDERTNYSQVEPSSPLPQEITTDKGFSVTLQRYNSSLPVINYSPRQINAREVIVDNVAKAGNQSTDAFMGIPEHTLDQKLYAPYARQLDLLMLRSLGKSYPTTAGKTYFAQDGSQISSIGISNRLNSNEDRQTYMSGAKIQAIRAYKRNTLIGQHKEGMITAYMDANDLDALWAELMVKRGWGGNTDYNSFNEAVAKQVRMRVQMPEEKLSEVEAEYGIKIIPINHNLYLDASDVLMYKDDALSSNVDDVNVYYQKQADEGVIPTLETYTATGNHITKSYFVVETMNEFSSLMEVFPTNFIGFEEVSALNNPNMYNYKQEKLFNGLALGKTWTQPGFVNGVHGPSHKAHLMSMFFFARMETRNVVEVHSKRTDIQYMQVNTNQGRTIGVDNVAMDIAK